MAFCKNKKRLFYLSSNGTYLLTEITLATGCEITFIAEVAPNVFNVAWYEETGTVVSQVTNLNSMTLYGFIAFPKWVWNNPEKTHGRKEQKLQELIALRDAGPDVPRTVIYESAKIFSVEDIGIDVPNVF